MEALVRCKEEDGDESYWAGKLRQYAHMIDKGLHRGDFSKGHGAKAYGLAQAALSHIRLPERSEDPSVRWAVEKIRQYEKLQSGELPELRNGHVRTCCTYEDLLDAIRTRRSIRRYLNKPVGQEEIERITDVLDWAPTSCHRQPARVYASNDPDVVRRCVNLHAGAACFTDIYAPLLLVFCADGRLYSMPAELAMPYIDVALGVQNCVLVAHSLGLSLTLLTWANPSDAQERELRKIFSIPPYFRIVVSAVGGYPECGAQVPVRKNKELFVRGGAGG
jgi:nitroreductase